MSKPEKDTSEKTFIRTCKLCGREFIAPTNNTMRCPECRKVMRQQQSAASYKRFLTKMEMRKMREKTTQGGVTAEKKKDGVPISYWSAALNMLADSVDSGRSDSDPLRGADSARGAGMAGNGDHKTGSCYAPVCR